MTATLESLGEIAVAERIRSRLRTTRPQVLLGPGDDAAIVRAPRDRMVLTVDTQREGTHFRRQWLDAGDLGRRALAVSVSDIAAMGARPLCALCSLVLPGATTVEWFDGLIDGLERAAEELDCPVVGGDVSQPAAGVSLCMTVIGSLGPGQPAARRAGARPGDHCVVVGRLGRAAVGRDLLAAGRRPQSAAERACIEAYRRPVPRVEEGGALAPYVSAMMDVSDGLTLDLQRLCRASGVGAELDAQALADPVVEEVAGDRALEAVLGGGDDYALLAAVPERHVADALVASTAAGEAARVVGRFRVEAGMRLLTGAGPSALEPRGWDPFSGGEGP